MEKGIEKVLKAIEEVRKQEKRKFEEEIKREEERRKREEEYRQYRKAVFEESLKLAEQIFEWAEKLFSYKEIGEVFAFINEKGFIDAGLALKNMIPIFHGSGYYKTRPVEDKHAYASLYLKKDGTFFYRERWKWAEGIHINIETPEEMARKLDPKFIKEILDTIKSEKVWEIITNQIREMI